MCGSRRWYIPSVLDFQITAAGRPPALTDLSLWSERTQDSCGLCKCDIYLHECSDEEWTRTGTVMSDLSHFPSQVKINYTKSQPPGILHIFPTFMPIDANIRKVSSSTCFLFSKYAANKNNRELVGKSEGMKNAESLLGDKLCPGRATDPISGNSKMTVSLKIGFPRVSGCCH